MEGVIACLQVKSALYLKPVQIGVALFRWLPDMAGYSFLNINVQSLSFKSR
tara:strand:- start:87293 stop:87445 length:153 start_codon:yes stop_codon:yes gene_type:complete